MLKNDLPARGVQVENGLVIHVLGRHHRLDDILHQVLVDLVIGHVYKQTDTVRIKCRQHDNDMQQIVIKLTGQNTKLRGICATIHTVTLNAKYAWKLHNQ